LVDIYGKVSGSEAMTNAESYHPLFTLDRLHDFQSNAIQDLFFHWAWPIAWWQIGALWATLAIIAWWRADRPVLRFLFWFLIVVPLPIEFLPGKRAACIVLLLVAGAMFAAVVFTDVVTSAAQLVSRGFHTRPRVAKSLAGAMVAFALFFWVREQWRLRREVEGNSMRTLGVETWDIIEQMRASEFHPRHNSFVVFIEDPFQSFDMYFLASLWVHDRSVKVHVPRQGSLTPEELAHSDYIFAIRDRRLLQLK
jgi:hypothetical protein